MHENLDCAATNCVYNSSQLCYAGNIKVDGRQAMSTDGTYCASFEDREKSGMTNSADSSKQVNPNDIHCEATKCKYNESELCKAESVHINANDASCETFVSK
ncbi:DUF1540 domain-containing protein [Clostridioides mangenotii]|uniref:DUF1540 domain-containing protein n=1 Tax=Metaclostridioides mangenotii TaxID=1540 RepID=UPI001F262074|nr:DUF1540 domain-containing protein [Clostridioides mangenotii]MCR1954763.1 DUF1540 domain-containing protein [Clostridioides mangenotii]